ncbi:hypothetical protein A3A45_03015 [Candidatus Daviesbacteria bacterium RIFCSPLOWO2_01_FULL_36_8]|nr:MAG: hypothetical protein A3A45_03015 [Candidatus Daviesbacteria bacterium RIFCSPLOWO2_01_FULL_36_8]
MIDETLHVRILSPQALLLDTQATSVSSTNVQGPFDILPEHANFITMVENSPIIIRSPGQKQTTYTFSMAIIYTMENQVNIYTYIQAPSLPH